MRLTPTWEQAHAIIAAVKRQSGKDILSAMLYLGLGQADRLADQGRVVALLHGRVEGVHVEMADNAEHDAESIIRL